MAESCRMYQHHTLYKRCIPNPSCDREILHFLYTSEFLHPFPGQYRNDGDIFWNCFHQALEANKKGYDGKRRILSIIAEKFSYNILMEKLKIAQGTIFEAKKYARINGLGCVVIEKPIRKVKRITSEQKQQFDSFSQDKAHVIMSSYKTDAKTGQPVVYLKNTKNLLWEKFKENFPNGIKRTTFYTQLMGRQYIYREDLGGLCSTCSTYGYETFEEIINLIKEKINDVELQDIFSQRCHFLKCYLKKEYEEHLVVTGHGITSHDPCINHCLLYAFGECNTPHTHVCNECQKIFQFFQDLKNNLGLSYHEEIQEYQNRILYYLAHQTRKTYLNAQFNAALLDLNEDSALLVVDYKMKILPKTARETKQEFFGKKGWALHTVLLYTKPKESFEINIQAIDHWSTDARQDAWFSACSLHSVIENLDIKPKWISIISDNGPHYHNSELMIIMSKWYEWYGIQVKKWIFLEASEAKTTVDSHHAQISLSIKRYIRIGGEIQEGSDITSAIKNIAGTSVAHIEPNQIKENKGKSMTIPGISNWFEWTWPIEGEDAGYIKARAMPNVGKWTLFSPAHIQKLLKGEINQPSPQVSETTKPKSPWKIPIPHSSGKVANIGSTNYNKIAQKFRQKFTKNFSGY
ncbi:unnamed protein product [Rhizophagus irregularis]|nr:unnamed protein product [Rhizophagus irregularis]